MCADLSNQSPVVPAEDVQKWEAFYRRKLTVGRYPTEWVIRTLAGGNYPTLKLDKSRYPEARILDLSCGDGRNLPLLLDLGFHVHATEISEPLVNELRNFATKHGWPVSFEVGRNTALPYPARHFNYLLSCASCYYMDSGTAWEQVMHEIARVVQPGGIFIANLPDPDNAVLSGADALPDGSMIIRHDPFNLRNGLRFMVARSRDDVARLLSPWFVPLSVGHQDDDFYGLRVSAYIFAAQRL